MEDYGLSTRIVRFQRYGPWAPMMAARKGAAAMCRKVLRANPGKISLGRWQQTRCSCTSTTVEVFIIMRSDYRKPLNLAR